jgi:hypothetical protein
MKKNRNSKKSLLFGGIAMLVIVSVLGVFQIGKAQLTKSQVEELTDLARAVNGDKEVMLSAIQFLGDAVGVNFGVGETGTRFPYGISADSTSPIAGEVRGTTLTITGTTTVQEITIGSRFSESLTFTAGSTTTPGSLVSIQNTGETKICELAQIDISTASAVGGLTGVGSPFQFGLGTSTAATNWTGATLIASTTVATTSAIVLDSQENAGSYNGKSFVWTAGEYINGAFNILDNQASASSTAYTSMVGKLYLVCHTR